VSTFKTARPLAKLREGRADWYRITNRADTGVTDLYIYDEIGYFGVTAADLVNDLRGISGSEIELHLNTPGGEVFDGLAIYNALKHHPANVTVYVDSLAASIGSVIAMAGDRVIMGRNATMMIHDGHGLSVGNAADMREMADLLDKTSDNIASVYAERTGTPTATWRKAMKAETWYNANEAVKAGLADEVQGTGSGQANTWDLSIFNFAGRDTAPEPTIDAPVEPDRCIEWDPEVIRRALKEATHE
jgi:ATP-dependent protease ClpP protease subunit